VPPDDWSDIPIHDVVIAGVPFDKLTCCERERFGLLLISKSETECRLCGRAVRRGVI
jgi:hypothetical protein